MTCRTPLTITASLVAWQRALRFDLFLCLHALYTPRTLVNVELSAGNINRRECIFSISTRMFRGAILPFMHDENFGEALVTANSKNVAARLTPRSSGRDHCGD